MKNSPEPSRKEAPPRYGGASASFQYRVAGAVAGAVNGLFGGGGGIPLLMLLVRWAGVEEKRAFATSVAVVFPLCAVSAVVCLLRQPFPIVRALPYLAGGLLGGWIGGRLFARVSAAWLRWIFALFLLYGAWRYLT